MTFLQRKAKPMLWVLAGMAIVTLFVFRYVDDWSRDLTTNIAATDEASDSLRPLVMAIPPEQALEALRSVVARLPRWQEQDASAQEAAPTETILIHLVRTTALMRFKDDIHVRLIASEDGQQTTVHVRSQSRIGRGDLGQNPRSIRELLGKLHEKSTN